MGILELVFCLGCLVASAVAWAAPPVDLLDFKSVEKQEAPQQKRIKEEDLVFTDPTAPTQELKDAVRARTDIIGRNKPSREGKPLFKIAQGQSLRFLKFSNDKRWGAVETYDKHRKAWVPLTAITTPPKNDAQ